MVPNPTLKLSFHAKEVIFQAEWNAWHIKMFLLYRGIQPIFLQNDFKEDYPPFHWYFLLITGLTYTFYTCKYPSQNYHRDSWNISWSFPSENNVVFLFKLVFILKNTPFSFNHLMYILIHTVFPALFQPIAGHVTMRYPDLMMVFDMFTVF
jgi:hypothetical protein